MPSDLDSDRSLHAGLGSVDLRLARCRRARQSGIGAKQAGNDHLVPFPVQQPGVEDRTAFRRLGTQRPLPLEVPERQWMDPGRNPTLQAAQTEIDVVMNG